MSISLIRLAPAAAIGALSIALVHVVAAADPSPSPAPAASASESAPTRSTAAAKTVEVNTYHFAYAPDPITIRAGTKVTFKNSDDVAHTVTSSDDKPAFDSGDMPKNATWSHVFAKAGTYAYYCRYHTYMKGTIVVK